VECIGKGKAHARYEFGVKVSIATTNAQAPGGQFVLGARTLPGNPYDGHTLAAGIAQAERITGVGIERAYADRGYRGHDAGGARVILSGQKRGVTPTIRRERRRRSAIEPVIGHMRATAISAATSCSARRATPPTSSWPRGAQPPPAPGLARLALCVPAQPDPGNAPHRATPDGATRTRLKYAYFTGDYATVRNKRLGPSFGRSMVSPKTGRCPSAPSACLWQKGEGRFPRPRSEPRGVSRLTAPARTSAQSVPMSTDGEPLSALIDRIYDAAAGFCGWDGVLSDLARLLGGSAAVLGVVGPNCAGRVVQVGVDPPAWPATSSATPGATSSRRARRRSRSAPW
jgi:hypothetical protein